jgi:hypothetical protein
VDPGLILICLDHDEDNASAENDQKKPFSLHIDICPTFLFESNRPCRAEISVPGLQQLAL